MMAVGCSWRAAFGAVALGLIFVWLQMEPVAAVSQAVRDQARAACKKKYGKAPDSVKFSKDLKNVTCIFGSAKSAKTMSRSEAFNYCRDKYHATAIIVSRTKTGWLCRYYGP